MSESPVQAPPAEATAGSGPASERILDGLRRQILTGRLAPGSRIRQEDLAAEFGASRLPVRDALRRLEAEGLVRLVAHTGAWVAQLSMDELTEAYLVRERLEPLLLGLSVPHLTTQDLEELADLAERMDGADLETFLSLDREFHLRTFRAAPTHLLGDIVLRLWNTTQHYRRAFAELVGVAHSPATHAEHRLLVDALRRGQAADAEAVLALHIRRTRTELTAHPELFT